MPQQGIIGDVIGWVSHPIYSSGNTFDWGAGIVALLIVSFLWSTVTNSIVGKE